MGRSLTLLARTRARRGLTLRQLSELSGISEDAITAAEQARRRPRLTTLAKLSEALELDIDDVVDDLERVAS